MKVPKNYFHDKTVLLLISASGFIAVINSVFLLLRINFSESYIFQFRDSVAGEVFVPANATAFLYFIGFALFTVVFHTVVSMRMYYKRRHYAYVMLSLGLLLLVFLAVVSNALIGSVN